MEIQTQFYIGEKDGARPLIDVPALPRRGTILYTWRTKDDVRIAELTHKPDRQIALMAELSVLAYRFEGHVLEREGPPGVKCIKEYVFRRYEAADKAVHDPAL